MAQGLYSFMAQMQQGWQSPAWEEGSPLALGDASKVSEHRPVDAIPVCMDA